MRTLIPAALAALAAASAFAEESTDAFTGTDETGALAESFAALAAPLTVGEPGMPNSTSLSRGEGCIVIYEMHVDLGPTVMHGTARIDLAKVSDEPAKVRDPSDFTNIEMRRAKGVESAWEAGFTADAGDPAAFKQAVGGSCDDSGCTAELTDPHPTLTLIGPDQEARAAAVVAALTDYRTACTK